jgi:asparagine N-glycosylation enzyme membrane subunit Stt3
MGSEEEEAYKLARYLDANYILVIFGGVSYYSGDDISKFLWMIRIAGKFMMLLINFFSWRVPSDQRKQLLHQWCLPH